MHSIYNLELNITTSVSDYCVIGSIKQATTFATSEISTTTTVKTNTSVVETSTAETQTNIERKEELTAEEIQAQVMYRSFCLHVVGYILQLYIRFSY